MDAKLLEEGFKCGKFIKLQECFRMPHALIKHIDSEKVLPTSDLPKAKDVKCLGVVEENIDFPAGYSIKSMAEILAKKLHTEVMMRGIHPGHCVVVFDGAAALELFPPQDGGLPAFVQLVNSELTARNANKKSGCMLQIGQDIEGTLLYSSRKAPNLSASSVRTPLLSEPYTGGDWEETVESRCEGHSEVFLVFTSF